MKREAPRVQVERSGLGGVELKGGSQVKGTRTYLVHCGNQLRFVYVDLLKIALCIQSSALGRERKRVISQETC